MPITIDRLQSRIYASSWIDHVSIEDMQAAVAQRQELADADHARSYVSIVDVSRVGSIPFNLESLRQAMEMDPRVLRFLVVGVTLQARILVESLVKITQVKVEFVISAEDALQRAQALLEEDDQNGD